MFSQVFIRFDGLPFELHGVSTPFCHLGHFASIRCKVPLFPVSHFWGSVHDHADNHADNPALVLSAFIGVHRRPIRSFHSFSAIPLQPLGDRVGQSQAAFLRQDGGELLLGIIGGDFAGGVLAIADPPRAALPRGAQNLSDQESFELQRRVAHLFRSVRFSGGGGGQDDRRNCHIALQITSISASRAPAARKFCRIAITSRGVEPMEASARTSSSTGAPCFNTTLRAFSSLAVTLVCGATGVVRTAMGLGCETFISVWISTVRLPCRMATGDTRTSFPNTMVPVRSLMT